MAIYSWVIPASQPYVFRHLISAVLYCNYIMYMCLCIFKYKNMSVHTHILASHGISLQIFSKCHTSNVFQGCCMNKNNPMALRCKILSFECPQSTSAAISCEHSDSAADRNCCVCMSCSQMSFRLLSRNKCSFRDYSLPICYDRRENNSRVGERRYR